MVRTCRAADILVQGDRGKSLSPHLNAPKVTNSALCTRVFSCTHTHTVDIQIVVLQVHDLSMYLPLPFMHKSVCVFASVCKERERERESIF